MVKLSDAQWATYRKIINNAHNYLNQDTITWVSYSYGFQRYGEDNPTLKNTINIDLKVLISYNIFRTWPMTDETPSGAIDKESILVMLNKDYLSDLGYLNSDGFFNFSPGNDYFIHRGQKYRSSGETFVGQAKDDPLHIYLILKREKTETGKDKY